VTLLVLLFLHSAVIQKKDGLSDYDMFFVKTYAQETFLKLCKEFEDQMGIKWEAVENS
jgi:hypothetical protein